MPAPTPVTLRLEVRGIVQGVGFRQSLANRANALGLAGWVRNRRDGSVEAMLCGDPAKLELVKEWAHHGPPLARVIEVKASTAEWPDSDPEPSIPVAILPTA
ncbi:hypothetical protein CCR84_15745 [Rhodocyclus purpureus]|nr:hypothetical protein [Rhodocyclus purpureus]